MSDKILCQEAVLVEFTEEEKKIHHLLLTANFWTDLGICNGKMKAAVYFLGLYRRTGNRMYENFAFELLDEIYEAVNEHTPAGFGNGVCGIGWGFEYLIRERLLAVDEDICAKLDGYVSAYFHQGSYREIGLAAGLCGVLFYLLSRMESSRVVPGSGTMNANKELACRVLEKAGDMLAAGDAGRLLQAGCDPDYSPDLPFFYSGWDYPALLWCAGRLSLYGNCDAPALQLLEKLTEPLEEKENWPDTADKKKLLLSALAGVSEGCGDTVRRRMLPVWQYLACEDDVPAQSSEAVHFK